MSGVQISDAQIAAMSAQERRDLIKRLSRSTSSIMSLHEVRRLRHRRLALTIAAPLVLLPWIVYLAMSLPDHYVARNWAAAWVGFDIFLLAMFALTAVFGLLRRQLLLLTGFGTGLLLLCDAWFDVMTAAPDDRPAAITSALLVELPVAVLLISGTLRLVRVAALRFWLLEPGQPLWRVPLPVGEPSLEPHRRD
jgi:hypothetical protein